MTQGMLISLSLTKMALLINTHLDLENLFEPRKQALNIEIKTNK